MEKRRHLFGRDVFELHQLNEPITVSACRCRCEKYGIFSLIFFFFFCWCAFDARAGRFDAFAVEIQLPSNKKVVLLDTTTAPVQILELESRSYHHIRDEGPWWSHVRKLLSLACLLSLFSLSHLLTFSMFSFSCVVAVWVVQLNTFRAMASISSFAKTSSIHGKSQSIFRPFFDKCSEEATTHRCCSR